MSRFKIGDRVRRTHGEYKEMKKGDVDVVRNFYPNSTTITLKNFGEGHADYNFELISHTAQSMKELLE